MSDQKIRTSCIIPKYHHDRLRLWAWLKGTGYTTLASNVIQARVEANYDEIDRMLDYRASQLNITRETLIADILKGDDNQE